jgi:hypothetical protein
MLVPNSTFSNDHVKTTAFEQTSNHSYLFYPHASSTSSLVTSVSLAPQKNKIQPRFRNPDGKLYSSALLSLDQSTSERLRALETLKLSNGKI